MDIQLPNVQDIASTLLEVIQSHSHDGTSQVEVTLGWNPSTGDWTIAATLGHAHQSSIAFDARRADVQALAEKLVAMLVASPGQDKLPPPPTNKQIEWILFRSDFTTTNQRLAAVERGLDWAMRLSFRDDRYLRCEEVLRLIWRALHSQP